MSSQRDARRALCGAAALLALGAAGKPVPGTSRVERPTPPGLERLHDLGFRGRGARVALIDSGVEDDWEYLAAGVLAGSHLDHVDRAGIAPCAPLPIRPLEALDRPTWRGAAHHGRPWIPCRTERGERRLCHGTQMAGILIGEAAGSVGIVPEAELISLQVASPVDGRIHAASVIAALNEIADHWSPAGGVTAVSIGLASTGPEYGEGCEGFDPRLVRALELAVERLAELDIPVFAGAGNDASDGLAFPACLEGVIAVGAVMLEDSAVAFFPASNWSPGVDLAALGKGLELPVSWSFYPYHVSGTSAAAAVAAGSYALLASAFPRCRSAEILGALRSTGTPIRRPGDPFTVPSIDLDRAFEQLAQRHGGPVNGASDGRNR